MGSLGIDVSADERRFERYLDAIFDVLGHVGRAEPARAYRRSLLMARNLIGGLDPVIRSGDTSALDTWLEKQCAAKRRGYAP